MQPANRRVFPRSHARAQLALIRSTAQIGGRQSKIPWGSRRRVKPSGLPMRSRAGSKSFAQADRGPPVQDPLGVKAQGQAQWLTHAVPRRQQRKRLRVLLVITQ